MYKLQLQNKLILTLPDSVDLDSYSVQQWGRETAESLAVQSGYGFYGHLIGTGKTTPLDVLVALQQLGYRYKVLAGRDFVRSFVLPRGAVT